MNTLKIQIKPYYQNNPFNLKDDQIHCLSTNKDEEEIQLLLKQMNLSNYTVFLQLDMEKIVIKKHGSMKMLCLKHTLLHKLSN